jgi:SAM-dependent methyltransferase
VSLEQLRDRVRGYYDGKFRAHGPTPRGVDWNSEESQHLRFAQLARLWDGDPGASVLDYGCGYGALAAWLRARGHHGAYVGFDLSAAMTCAAAARAADLPDCRFTTDRASLQPADFAVASGVLNVRMDVPEAAWTEYVLATIADLAAVGHRGFAFNALTRHSDPARRRADLHYADPLDLFDHCRRFSPLVALLHDYPLYEFTILVRRVPGHG